MCFEYETAKEAKSKMSTIGSHRRKYNETAKKGYDASSLFALPNAFLGGACTLYLISIESPFQQTSVPGAGIVFM